MAEAYHVAVAPHNYNSTTVGLAATIHAAAVMPNFLITEYFVNFEALGRKSLSPRSWWRTATSSCRRLRASAST